MMSVGTVSRVAQLEVSLGQALPSCLGFESESPSESVVRISPGHGALLTDLGPCVARGLLACA